MYCLRSLCRFAYLYIASESPTVGCVSCTLSVLDVLDLTTSHSPAVNMTDWPQFQPGLCCGKATVNTLSDIHTHTLTHTMCMHVYTGAQACQIQSQIDSHTHTIYSKATNSFNGRSCRYPLILFCWPSDCTRLQASTEDEPTGCLLWLLLVPSLPHEAKVSLQLIAVCAVFGCRGKPWFRATNSGGFHIDCGRNTEEMTHCIEPLT